MFSHNAHFGLLAYKQTKQEDVLYNSDNTRFWLLFGRQGETTAMVTPTLCIRDFQRDTKLEQGRGHSVVLGQNPLQGRLFTARDIQL